MLFRFVRLAPRTFASPSIVCLDRPHLCASANKTLRTMTTKSASSTSFAAHQVLQCDPPLEPPQMYRTQPPPHHTSTDPAKRTFRSPWPSAGEGGMGFLAFLKIRLFEWEGVPMPPPKDRPQSKPCTWTAQSATDTVGNPIVFTWIGHAGCHFRIPMPDSSEYVTVLTDPVLSNRCSPSQYLGPARLQEPPTSVAAMAESQVPGVWPDLLVLSHNHYDHLDITTIKALISRPNGKPVPHIFCTLGVAPLFHQLGVPHDGVTELDWWQQRRVDWRSTSDTGNVSRSLKLTCVPAQHFSSRSLNDRNKTVWAGWVMEALAQDEALGSNAAAKGKGKRVYFAGDSGYRQVTREHLASGKPDSVLPFCPAFGEIGDLLGPIDLSAIPIGAYKPRIAMSPVHMDPIEAVQVHKQVRSKRSIGIHWGSFALAAEGVHEPPEVLKEETSKQDLQPDEFTVMSIGETRAF